MDKALKMAAKFVSEFEGLSLTPYKDSGGVPTIGYGTTKGVSMDMPAITKEKAQEWLEWDLKAADSFITKAVKPLLNINQRVALISFVYNVGAGNFKTSTLLRKLNSNDFNGAAKEFHKWVYAGGKKLNGLIKRRKAESELFLKPLDGENYA